MTAEVYRKSIFCIDLKGGDVVHEVFCVGRVERRTARKGSEYLSLEFLDRSGRIAGVAWEHAEELATVLVEGAFARVRGRVGEFRQKPQIEVEHAEPAPAALDHGEYILAGPVPGPESVAGIRRLVAGMEDPHLIRLLEAFLDDSEFTRRFEAAPAAKMHHHAYIGGLAEHTRSVMELCARAADHYGDLDRDLLLAGAFCHDIGKIAELAVEPGFPYTEEGSLLGHIPLGFALVRERIGTLPDFPADRATDLSHLVLSHQGELEWGSPVEPQTLEALVLHFLDNLDSKVAAARPHLDQVESGRTGWVKALGRSLFRRAPRPSPAPDAPAPPAPTGGGPDGVDPPSLFDALD